MKTYLAIFFIICIFLVWIQKNSAYLQNQKFALDKMDSLRRSLTSLNSKRVLSSLNLSDLDSKVVFVRCDLNVPLLDHIIQDDSRIKACLPTLNYLLNNKAKIVVGSHLGRPKQGPDPSLSMQPIAKRLSQLLNTEIVTAKDCVGDDAKQKINQLKQGQILLLENLRFHKEETKNDDNFSRSLANNIDIYVNDAFGTAHRAHSSTAGMTKYIDRRVAGFLLNTELQYLQNIIQNPVRPFTAIIGGSKVSTKISVIESMLDKVDRLILGGAMVFSFFKAEGLEVGNSIVENDKLTLTEYLRDKAKQKGVELILPIDVVIANKFAQDADFKVVKYNEIPPDWIALDHGPETTKLINSKLIDSKTILWNGPLGVSEWPSFANGTRDVLEMVGKLTEQGVTTIVGGGDSVAAVDRFGYKEKISHISTGGGASLELLEGIELPGVAVLEDA